MMLIFIVVRRWSRLAGYNLECVENLDGVIVGIERRIVDWGVTTPRGIMIEYLRIIQGVCAYTGTM